ncbi:MAG: ABC transporter ATP-binding protein [Alphaproteobacteria bacterium PA4]|nr:MAG: ABC transporter ATP-binding protein [Alphaproteobacteria bacterium PA4]
MTATLAIDGLVVERGGRRVVDGLSLTLAPGDVYALLGGNGAGKSTTLFATLGLLQRSAGRVLVAGHDPAVAADAVRAATAYLPENVALYPTFTARENIAYFLDLASSPRGRDEVEGAFAAVKLAQSAWDRPVGGFSKGMRQKTAIALALLRRTPLLLLDEPTSGLDPAATRDFHALVADVASRGVSVLMVTHDLFGAADVAGRIGLLAGGRLAREWRAAATGPRFDLNALHDGVVAA